MSTDDSSVADRLREWQPIETAPKDGRRILAGRTTVFIALWNSRAKSWLDDAGYFRDPTHWMQLPTSPL